MGYSLLYVISASYVDPGRAAMGSGVKESSAGVEIMAFEGRQGGKLGLDDNPYLSEGLTWMANTSAVSALLSGSGSPSVPVITLSPVCR